VEIFQHNVRIKKTGEHNEINNKCQLINAGSAADFLRSDMDTNFDVIADELRKYPPRVKVGGNGFAFRFGEQNFIDTLNK
jgi:hypothetical protein